MPNDFPQLLSLATAVPPNVLTQDEIADYATAQLPRGLDRERAAKIFLGTGTQRRFAAQPMAWYRTPRGWPERHAVYVETAGDLFLRSAQAALTQASLKPSDVDYVVTVSTTGFACPSIEAIFGPKLGLRADVARIPVFGVGCAGGVMGLSLAGRLAKGTPGAVVLVVTTELCTLSFRPDRADMVNAVATALFGDGCAACVVSTKGEGIASITGSGEHQWPDTLDTMGWSIDPVGFGVILSRSVPAIVDEHLAPVVDRLLAGLGMARSDIDRFICHPGGPKVVVALERALALQSGALDHERAILADHANMSAPTVLFVLEKVLRQGLPPRTALLALGPGFTATCLTLTAGRPLS